MSRILIAFFILILQSQGRNKVLIAITSFDDLLIGNIYPDFNSEKLYFSSMSITDSQSRIINEIDSNTGQVSQVIKVSCNDQLEFLQKKENELFVFIGTGLNSNSINVIDLEKRSITHQIDLTSEDDEKFASPFYRPILYNGGLTVFTIEKSELEISWPLERAHKKEIVTVPYRLIDLHFDSMTAKVYLLQSNKEKKKLIVSTLDLITLRFQDCFEILLSETQSHFRSSYSGLKKISEGRIAVWLDYSKDDHELNSMLFIQNGKDGQLEHRFHFENAVISDIGPMPGIDNSVYAAVSYCTDQSVSLVEVKGNQTRIRTCMRSNIFSMNLDGASSEISLSHLKKQ